MDLQTARQPTFLRFLMISAVALMSFSWELPMAMAQLSRCTALTQGYSRCEAPSAWERSAVQVIQGPQVMKGPEAEGIRRRTEQSPMAELFPDPLHKGPILPPFQGASGYLNKLDPAKAVGPVGPGFSAEERRP